MRESYEQMIERYKRELVEFAKNNGAYAEEAQEKPPEKPPEKPKPRYSPQSVMASNRPLPRDRVAGEEKPKPRYSPQSVMASNRPLPRDAVAVQAQPRVQLRDTDEMNRPPQRNAALASDEALPRFTLQGSAEAPGQLPQNGIFEDAQQQLSQQVTRELPRLPQQEITYNEEEPSPELQPGAVTPPENTMDDFQRNNPKRGKLKVQVFAAQNTFPVTNAKVTVKKRIGLDDYKFFEGYTDISGIASGISLPAPDKNLSLTPGTRIPYAVYDITVEHPRFEIANFTNVPLFDGIESLQPVAMQPRQ